MARTTAPNSPESSPNLAPFRSRIRLLRASRMLAFGALIGAAISLVLAVLDYFGVRYMEAWYLAVPIVLGALIGLLRSLTEPLPEEIVARSVDRRAELADRLTTATAFAGKSDPLADAVVHDAAENAGALRARSIYPLRFGKIHGAALAMSAVAFSVFLLGNAPILKSAEARAESASLKKASEQIQRISKPILEAAKEPDTSQAEKELARRLNRFSQELNKGRLNKPEALVKANELAEQARKLEQDRRQNLQSALAKAQTAGEQLEKMAELGKAEKMTDAERMEQMLKAQDPAAKSDALGKKLESQQAKMNAMRADNQTKLQKNSEQTKALEEQMRSIESEMQKLEEALKNNKDPKTGEAMTPEMSEKMKKQLAELQKQLSQLAEKLKDLKLSKEAMKTFEKLMESPEFKEAQEILQKLAQKMQEQQEMEQAQQMAETGQMPKSEEQDIPKLTEEQLRQMEESLREQAKQMEELAKQLSDPKKMKEYAQALLDSAQAMKEMSRSNGLGMGIGMSFGLPGMGLGGMMGGGGIGSDLYTGPKGTLRRDDKSKLIQNAKFKDQKVTSQVSEKGPETYIEVTGPAQMGKPSSIPYAKALPKYEKSAESALNKGEIPARLKGKVRSYFDSLRR